MTTEETKLDTSKPTEKFCRYPVPFHDLYIARIHSRDNRSAGRGDLVRGPYSRRDCGPEPFPRRSFGRTGNTLTLRLGSEPRPLSEPRIFDASYLKVRQTLLDRMDIPFAPEVKLNKFSSQTVPSYAATASLARKGEARWDRAREDPHHAITHPFF